jgi:hypothetical protein
MINKQTRDKIVDQALKEMQIARNFKQPRTQFWKKNEDMYYGRKVSMQTESRANVELGKMQGFVHTILSKIDNPLNFKYIKGEEADYEKADLLNALKEKDSNKGDWNYKDILGKKQAVIYGRAIYHYKADSAEGYRSSLEPVDVYDFLIDPTAGGYDLESAYYMGRYNIVKTEEDLRQGVRDGIYISSEVRELINNGGTATASDNSNQEDYNKQNRYQALKETTIREANTETKYKFWEWYTTYDGERYYLLFTETGRVAIRVEKLKDVFASNLWPFWTYAAFPDLTEFWTPSYCDYVREAFMAQSITINQMLDNGEAVNKPMKIVNVDHVKNLSELKFRRDGYIKATGERLDVNQVMQLLPVPAINTPMIVYDKLDSITAVESGVTAGAKGVAEEDKVGIYEGNQANAADRFGFFNKSYSFGYKRFATLYYEGVMEHLTKKVAVQIVGIDGVSIQMVSKRDIEPYSDFDILIQSSDAESASDAVDKRNKLNFLSSQAANQMVNQKKAFEMEATIAGFSREEIRELLDVSEYGEAKLLSEASRDIQRILKGEKIEPNHAATVAYQEKIVNYMRDQKENLTDKQFVALTEYVIALDPIVMQNMSTMLMNEAAKTGGMGQVEDPNAPPTMGEAKDTAAIKPEAFGGANGQLPVSAAPAGNPVTGQQ